MRYLSFTIFLFLFVPLIKSQHLDTSSSKHELKDSILSIIAKYKATIGVSIITLDNKESLSINNDKKFPMQSVYKLPLAIAVLKKVDEGVFKLDQKIFIKKSQLHDTWSPLKEKYPEGNVSISIRELLAYTISRSDNNTCDILFELMGGTKNVNSYIQSLGLKDISIVATEFEMSKGWNVQYKNYTIPQAMGELLVGWYENKFLSDSSTQFLNTIMVDNYTSAMRLKGLLPSNTVVAHKTGTSGTNKKGISAGTNDVGIITMPNGKKIAIAVFVSNSTEKYETNEKAIAEIAFAAYQYYLNKN